MSDDGRDAAAVRIPPPLAYVGGIVLGALLHAFVLPFSIGFLAAARFGLTAILAVSGLGLMAAAIRPFRRTGQDPKPWKSTPEIISTGIYGFTRNPMYVSMALLQASIGVGLANGWIVVLVPLSIAVVYATAVRHEEAYLEQKFGEAYARYRSSVRRWL